MKCFFYHIEFTYRKGTGTLSINGKPVTLLSDIVAHTRYARPIWIGNPWYEPANVTIESLCIDKA